MLDCNADLVGSLEHVSDLRLLRQDHGGQSEVYLGGGGSGFEKPAMVVNQSHYRFQGQLPPGPGHGSRDGVATPLLGAASYQVVEAVQRLQYQLHL